MANKTIVFNNLNEITSLNYTDPTGMKWKVYNDTSNYLNKTTYLISPGSFNTTQHTRGIYTTSTVTLGGSSFMVRVMVYCKTAGNRSLLYLAPNSSLTNSSPAIVLGVNCVTSSGKDTKTAVCEKNWYGLTGDAGVNLRTSWLSGSTSTTNLTTGQWQHLHILYDSSTNKIAFYINGTRATYLDVTMTATQYYIGIGSAPLDGKKGIVTASDQSSYASASLGEYYFQNFTLDTGDDLYLKSGVYSGTGLSNPTKTLNFVNKSSGTVQTLQLYSDVSGADFITPHSGTAHLSPLLGTSDSKASVLRVIKSGTVYAPGTY